VQIRWQIGGTPNLKGAYVIQPQNNSTTVLSYILMKFLSSPPQMAMNKGTSTQTNFVEFLSSARAPNVHEKNPYLCILLQLTPFNKSKTYESKMQQVY
jgi:hypothetical protein